jgi:hypothetical protein
MYNNIQFNTVLNITACTGHFVWNDFTLKEHISIVLYSYPAISISSPVAVFSEIYLVVFWASKVARRLEVEFSCRTTFLRARNSRLLARFTYTGLGSLVGLKGIWAVILRWGLVFFRLKIHENVLSVMVWRKCDTFGMFWKCENGTVAPNI